MQVVFGEVIQVGPNDNIIQVLGSYLSDRLLKNCQIVDIYSHPTAPHSFREGTLAGAVMGYAHISPLHGVHTVVSTFLSSYMYMYTCVHVCIYMYYYYMYVCTCL